MVLPVLKKERKKESKYGARLWIENECPTFVWHKHSQQLHIYFPRHFVFLFCKHLLFCCIALHLLYNPERPKKFEGLKILPEIFLPFYSFIGYFYTTSVFVSDTGLCVRFPFKVWSPTYFLLSFFFGTGPHPITQNKSFSISPTLLW